MDCTPDISHNEQLSLLFRIVNMNDNNTHSPEIQEYFLDFIPVQSTTGLNLSNVLIDKLNEYGIDIMNCRGQAYDNGSNMVGKYQGVQTRVTNQNPRAFFTPCASHNLNLVLRDAAKNSSRASTFFGTVQRIYTIFSASTSRWDIFKKFCSIFTVKQWSETRWENRVNSVKALRFQLSNIIEALEEVSETANDSIAKSDARSLITEISTYEFILSLIIWYDILVQVNIVSKSLQGKDADINISNDMLQSLLAFLKSYRESGFMNAKIIANNLAEEIEVEPVFKKTRPRKKKKNFDYEGNDERINDEEDNFRQEYFLLVIDQATSSVENRFKQIESYKDYFGFLFRIGKLRYANDDNLMKYCKDLEINLKDGNSKDIDFMELYNELINFRLIVNEETTPLEALSVVKYSSECFPNIGIALRILLTIPVTSACAERSFSKLKLIKTYLRNKLSQENLSGLSIISIEKDISESLDYDDIINQFAAKKSRKVMF
ncbi:zinc finger MYM-type protein 1-like [Myzus persicae]|uniref:zinc finger MYM-type protein 1-like n=1 Tax=Myzus persicae TaxID=13164 RepID=UPI000B9361D2|nr:zinc finger MYM-type protein 1-like [Myzus persicae]